MHYNQPHATATWGTMGTDWERGVDFSGLIQERFERAQQAVNNKGLGAVLTFDFDNIRYITGTHIGEWCRDKMNRYALCPSKGKPYLFDPALPAKRITCPWMEDRMEAPISNMCGSLPPAMDVQKAFARQIKRVLSDYGLADQPLGVDLIELSMLRALEDEGITVVDGQQAMLDAREIKTANEIELLKQAASMVDAVYEDIARAIRPGRRENELVSLANEKLFLLGSERVECVNVVSGARGKPHSHTFADRIIQPGDMVFLDIMHSFNGYHTCYYRTFICGKPNKYQIEAYEKASEWISAGIDVIKAGVTTADVAEQWPQAKEFGYRNEDEAYLLQYGHGIGLSLWERPILSRRFNFEHPTEIKEGMVFAVETWCGAADGSGAARIEEEIVVTKDGCQIITNYPSDHLISCGLPGCEVY
ncbi:M24 family metallopeptidase [Desulfovibrio inopinatus]|uniref:M24 family metallopeptidase n=1 Tax=Desulfovibrio inopinatus TaxID=102109 RepID=UPI0003FE8B45|nr:Xaa-Pro peptidase family protein [Desulfovibrio inopinatus]